MLILEESVVDLGAERLVSLTRNLNHKKLVVATETTEYTPSRGEPDKTLMTRRTSVRSPLSGLTGRMIEGVCHARAIRNVKRAVQVKVGRRTGTSSQSLLLRDFRFSLGEKEPRRRRTECVVAPEVISERANCEVISFRRDSFTCSRSRMERSLRESLQESPSADFVMRLYVIYGLLYLLVLVLDYFLWTSKFRFACPLVKGSPMTNRPRSSVTKSCELTDFTGFPPPIIVTRLRDNPGILCRINKSSAA